MRLFDRKNIIGNFDIVVWWGVQRILYNIIMFFVGILSFVVGFVTIPLIYILIAINLNILFTLSWIIELVFIKSQNSEILTENYIKYFFVIFYSYSIFSVLFYIYFPELLNWTLIPYGL